MNVSTYTLSTEQLEEQVNIVKTDLLIRLYNKGLIDEKAFNIYMKNYAYIIRKPSFFGKIWLDIFNSKDTNRYILIKQVSFKEPKEPKEEAPNHLQVVELRPEDKTRGINNLLRIKNQTKEKSEWK